MTGYETINLLDLLDSLGEQELTASLKNFLSPYNADVEDFIQNKAITFAKQNLASVWLVLTSYKDEIVPAGYFALTLKSTHIDLKKVGSNLRKRLAKFAAFNKELGKYILSAPLIGQLGKNYACNFDKLITGDELLNIACEKVKEGQRIFGGKAVYLECEDIPALIEFYRRNDFFEFGSRSLEREEKGTMKTQSLKQFIKYLK